MTLVLRLLGEVVADADGPRIDLGGARQRCVLAALAVDTGRVVPLDRLVERVWGSAASPRARATLHGYISRLRRALASTGEVAILRRSGGYLLLPVLAGPVTDLHRFRELRKQAQATDSAAQLVGLLTEATSWWRGDALTGLDSAWVDVERLQLHGERLAAQHDLVDARLRLGHGPDLVAELSARIVEQRLDERVAGQYLQALYQAGRSGDALAYYQRFRERLVEELGAEPGSALQGVHQSILTAGPVASPESPNVAGVATPPRQLPAPPGSFVGRSDELDRLDALANSSPKTVVISAVSGAGGIGKTWLALHWADRHADRFPDGQLFVDLRGFSPDDAPMAPAVATRGLLSALGVDPERIPVDAHAQSALFRSLLAGKQVLLILDNAADTAQVSGLLPGSGSCMVLVTSRNRLAGLITGHGAHHLPLGVLPGHDARALLAGRLGSDRVAAEPAGVGELVDLCGGFPLALSIVAGRARSQPDLSLTALAAELRDLGLDALDDGEPDASLAAVLSWSHCALTAHQAVAFESLGLAPGPDIGVPAVASLLASSPAEASKRLRELERASLVHQEPPGRWRMHDLIRRYASGVGHRLPPAARKAASRRVLDFYLHAAHAADNTLYPHSANPQLDTPSSKVQQSSPRDIPAALAWFTAEHANLMDAQRLAVENEWHEVVWQLTWVMNTFQTRRGHWHDQLRACQAGVAAVLHLSDPVRQILAHRLLGRAYLNLERRDEATAHLQKALDLAREHQDCALEADTHRTLASAWERWNDPGRAMGHAVKALEIRRNLDDPVGEATALNAVGWCANQLGDHDGAREYCRSALALFRRHNDSSGEAATLDSLGSIDQHTRRHRQAVENYRQALALYRRLGDINEAARTLTNIGHPHVALEQYELARVAWGEAETLYRQQGRNEDADLVERLQGTLGQPDGEYRRRAAAP
jgi:DNA-binding SARP family transcriptional activator/tetratricopeptide (TPR) repeat protein